MNHIIVDYLNRLRNIYLAVDDIVLKQDITKIDHLIKTLEESKETTTSSQQQKKKKSFSELFNLIAEKKFEELNGVRVDYKNLKNKEEVEHFIEALPKNKILKETTALDLKLLYSLLTGDSSEIKGTKTVIFDAIQRNIRARKRGEAFKNAN